jgi:hypothetical protein
MNLVLNFLNVMVIVKGLLFLLNESLDLTCFVVGVAYLEVSRNHR